MDVARFRSAAPRLTRVRGIPRPIPIRPLTRGELLGVDDQLEQRFGRHAHSVRTTATRVAVLELATGIADVGELDAAEVRALFAAWERVQDDSNPDVEQLGAEVELQLIEGRGYLISDAQAAAHAGGPADFYGAAVCNLTDGQLAYFLALQAAHERWSERQCRTAATLRKLARRSETTSRRGAAR